MFYKLQKVLLNLTKDEKAKAKKSADLDLRYGKINKDERDKQIATADDEPYIKVLQVHFDQKQPNVGSFELDWNEEFIKHLWKAGYKDDNEHDTVDRWFTNLCRNIALETWEKEQAMVTQKNDLGDGRTEYK